MKNDADLTTGQFQRFRINAKIIPLAPVNADERNEGKKKVRHAHIPGCSYIRPLLHGCNYLLQLQYYY